MEEHKVAPPTVTAPPPHMAPVTQAVLCRGGSRAISLDKNNAVWRKDITTDEKARIKCPNASAISSLCVTADGSQAVFQHRDSSPLLYQVADDKIGFDADICYIDNPPTSQSDLSVVSHRAYEAENMLLAYLQGRSIVATLSVQTVDHHVCSTKVYKRHSESGLNPPRAGRQSETATSRAAHAVPAWRMHNEYVFKREHYEASGDKPEACHLVEAWRLRSKARREPCHVQPHHSSADFAPLRLAQARGPVRLRKRPRTIQRGGSQHTTADVRD